MVEYQCASRLIIINQESAENEHAKKKINPADHLVEFLNISNPGVSSSARLFLLNLVLIKYQTIRTKGTKKKIDELFSNQCLLSKIASYPAASSLPAEDPSKYCTQW